MQILKWTHVKLGGVATVMLKATPLSIPRSRKVSSITIATDREFKFLAKSTQCKATDQVRSIDAKLNTTNEPYVAVLSMIRRGINDQNEVACRLPAEFFYAAQTDVQLKKDDGCAENDHTKIQKPRLARLKT
jgi:hypothetical protein